MKPSLRCAAWLSTRMRAGERGDRGASAVEYGLIVAGVTAAFIVGTAGFNSVLAQIFHQALTGVGATTP